MRAIAAEGPRRPWLSSRWRRALAAWLAAVTLAAVPASAAEPPAGTKNFTAPASVPNYFTDEKGRARAGEAPPSAAADRAAALPHRLLRQQHRHGGMRRLVRARTSGKANRLHRAAAHRPGVRVAAARHGRPPARTAAARPARRDASRNHGRSRLAMAHHRSARPARHHSRRGF